MAKRKINVVPVAGEIDHEHGRHRKAPQGIQRNEARRRRNSHSKQKGFGKWQKDKADTKAFANLSD
jgi:hypothetical protein